MPSARLGLALYRLTVCSAPLQAPGNGSRCPPGRTPRSEGGLSGVTAVVQGRRLEGERGIARRVCAFYTGGRALVKKLVLISTADERIDLAVRRYTGADRRKRQIRMGIGRRIGARRRTTSETLLPGTVAERRKASERRGSANRRRVPDRRIGLSLDLNRDLSDLDL